VTLEDRGRFLLDYIDLLMMERVDDARQMTHERWVVNKLRAHRLLVYEGIGERVSPAHRDQTATVARCTATADCRILRGRPLGCVALDVVCILF